MNTESILRLLENSGFRGLGFDGANIFMEDPSCVMRSIGDFIDLAWLGLYFVVGLFLFGWAISIIRGGKAANFFENTKNLVLILGILAAAKPIASFIYGKDLWSGMCKTITVPVSEIQRVVALEDSKFTLPPAAPDEVVAAGNPQEIGGVEVSENEPREAVREEIVMPGTDSSGAAVSIEITGKDVIYTSADGKKIKRSGGSSAWRNKNPGNITCSDFARKHGGLGCNGRFAVFSGESTGFDAIKSLLRTSGYQNKTVGEAIAKWAPPHENDTVGYQREMEKKTGIPINTPMSSLTAAQLEKVANTIKQIEGWKVGREEKL